MPYNYWAGEKQRERHMVLYDKKAKECYDKNKENISNRENVVPCLNTIDEIVERKINLFKNIK